MTQSQSQKCVIIRVKFNENGEKSLQSLMHFSGKGELPIFNDVKDLFPEMEQYSWNDKDLLWVYINPEVVSYKTKDRLSNKLIWVYFKESLLYLDLNNRFLLYYGVYSHSKYADIYPIFKDVC